VKNTEHDDFVVLAMQLMHDNVWQSLHDPFMGTGDQTEMPDMRELTQLLGSRTDARDHAARRLVASSFGVA
jgi:hypothetical protein